MDGDSRVCEMWVSTIMQEKTIIGEINKKVRQIKYKQERKQPVSWGEPGHPEAEPGPMWSIYTTKMALLLSTSLLLPRPVLS